MIGRLRFGLGIGLSCGLLVGAVGAAGNLTGSALLGGTWATAALGPTAYVVSSHSHEVGRRVRDGVLAHAVGIVAGLVSLAAFGLWNEPSVAETHRETLAQAGAQATALALTLLVLTLAAVQHAPATATTLLITSGIAAPGTPLVGLVVGLAIVLAVAPLLARLFGTRPGTGSADGRGRPAG